MKLIKTPGIVDQTRPGEAAGMTNMMEGVVTIVQESRFQLTDDEGVSHLFVLGHKASAEPEQLPPLQDEQARVRVHYKPAKNLIGNIATSITRAS